MPMIIRGKPITYGPKDRPLSICYIMISHDFDEKKGRWEVVVDIHGGRSLAHHGQPYLNKLVLHDLSITTATKFAAWVMSNGWQDIERIWMDVDLVYETRWDCLAAPERVRLAA